MHVCLIGHKAWHCTAIVRLCMDSRDCDVTAEDGGDDGSVALCGHTHDLVSPRLLVAPKPASGKRKQIWDVDNQFGN